MTLLSLGIFYMIYGVAGILGFQYIPQKYRNRSWTGEFIRSRGIFFLITGALWIFVYIIDSFHRMNWITLAAVLILFSAPPMIYAVRTEKKYKLRLAEENR